MRRFFAFSGVSRDQGPWSWSWSRISWIRWRSRLSEFRTRLLLGAGFTQHPKGRNITRRESASRTRTFNPCFSENIPRSQFLERRGLWSAVQVYPGMNSLSNWTPTVLILSGVVNSDYTLFDTAKTSQTDNPKWCSVGKVVQETATLWYMSVTELNSMFHSGYGNLSCGLIP